MNKTTISTIIITKNAGEHLARCLESVKWTDEIIILDCGSEDNTIDIAKQYTDKITITDDWPGFGPQKNRALQQASNEWVLSIDADEWLPAELITEIQQTLAVPSAVAYWFKRKSEFCGKLIKYGDWRNDRVLRLFKRNLGKFSNDLVHEKLIITGPSNTLTHAILHKSFTTLESAIHKMDHYSTLSAQMKSKNNKKSSLGKAITHALWTFIRGYFLRYGFLDGQAGLMLAISNAEGCYYRYAKLALINKNNKKSISNKKIISNF
jgi:glycosyltransferase involved in cell wall biosynthesis